MNDVLDQFYGPLLMVRPPPPVTFNKAGANYKSEVAHLNYSPRAAYAEWLAICEGIVQLGGDALFCFESDDERFLDQGDLRVDAEGQIANTSGAVLGRVDEVMTGRVFTANGPWVIVEGKRLCALMPQMLAHRTNELAYYEQCLQTIANECGLSLEIQHNPHRWEGLADVAVLSDKAVFTYTVRGHYDAAQPGKTMRSSLEGVKHAAAFAGLSDAQAVYAQLVYPHFHGDTVHFALREPGAWGAQTLVHYRGGLWQGSRAAFNQALGGVAIDEVGQIDAVEAYAGNSRQVLDGVLVPEGVSPAFVNALRKHGLSTVSVHLHELFGKAGGGPACATLFLPRNLNVPSDAGLRFSVQRDLAHARLERLPETLRVDPAYFSSKTRG